jgi:hypothetical protein
VDRATHHLTRHDERLARGGVGDGDDLSGHRRAQPGGTGHLAAALRQHARDPARSFTTLAIALR